MGACYCGGSISICSFCVFLGVPSREELKKLKTGRDSKRDKWERRLSRYDGHGKGDDMPKPVPKPGKKKATIKKGPTKKGGKKQASASKQDRQPRDTRKRDRTIEIYKSLTVNGQVPQTADVVQCLMAELNLDKKTAQKYAWRCTSPKRWLPLVKA